jgi:FkbM family methyltransferase
MRRLQDRPNFGQSLEILLSALYHRIIRPGDMVIDGGANGGLHTIPMARLVGRQGHVIAYEPQPQPFESLRRWIAYEKLDNIIILRKVALGSHAGKAIFYQNVVNDGLSSLKLAGDKLSDWRQLTVDVVRLDDEPTPRRCSFIKLDIEGGEYNAIIGGQSMIARDRPIIAMEHGFGWAAKRFRYESREFIRLFDEIGYCVWDFLNNRVMETNYSDDFLVWEFIAAPSESILGAVITDTIDEFIKNYDKVPPAADWQEVMLQVQAPFSTGYWGPS